MPTQSVSIMVYDFPAISRFFRSVALAVATQQTTQLQWNTYRDSSVLNAVYSVMFWKEPPGNVEVRIGTRHDIEQRTDQMHLEFLRTWLRRLEEGGPQAGNSYVTRMEILRNGARDAVQGIFSDAGVINDEIIGQTNDAIRTLAQIKLGAQVGVAVIGAVAGVAFVAAAAAGGGVAAGAGLSILGVEAGAGATVFAAAGAAHSITHSVIKNWEGGTGAQVAGIAWEGGKATTSEIGGHIAGNTLENALKGGVRSEQLIRGFEGEIRQQSARLAQEGLRRKARQKAAGILADRTARVAAQRGAIETAGRTAVNAARVGKGIPVVFAAWDIIDAFSDYRETTGALH
jgi:hypothetical protein